MYLDGTALKGQLFNPYLAASVGEGADGSTLTDGHYMFYWSATLTSWTVDLPNLTNGDHMFNCCGRLTSFAGDLSKLENGTEMFLGCTNLSSFNAGTEGLKRLTNGSCMFEYCYGLTSWNIDLPNLTNGSEMFYDCRLTSFNTDLPNLTNGRDMFRFCILDETSVLHILNTIPTHTSGTHWLNLGDNRSFLTSTDIASLLGTTTPIAAGTYNYKGWTITVEA